MPNRHQSTDHNPDLESGSSSAPNPIISTPKSPNTLSVPNGVISTRKQSSPSGVISTGTPLNYAKFRFNDPPSNAISLHTYEYDNCSDISSSNDDQSSIKRSPFNHPISSVSVGTLTDRPRPWYTNNAMFGFIGRLGPIFDKLFRAFGLEAIGFNHVTDNLREVLPVVTLIGFSTGCAGIIYAIEHAAPVYVDVYMPPSIGCLSNNSYWASLSFINSLSTTVGYGNIYPCTVYGRIFSIFYIIIAIPVNVLVLDNIGKGFLKVLHWLWPRLRSGFHNSCFCFYPSKKGRLKSIITISSLDIAKNGHLPNGTTNLSNSQDKNRKIASATSSVVKPDDGENDDDDDGALPFSLGLFITLLWVFATAVYFSIIEGWSYITSIYFTFVSLTTVGLGDYAPLQFELTIPHYTFIFIGLSILSTCVNIMQEKVDVMIMNLQRDIMKEYKDRMLEGESYDDTTDGGHLASDPLSQARHQGWISSFMSNKQKNELKEMYMRSVNMHVKGCQATVRMVDARCNATAKMTDAEIENVAGLSIDSECQTEPHVVESQTQTTPMILRAVEIQSERRRFQDTDADNTRPLDGYRGTIRRAGVDPSNPGSTMNFGNSPPAPPNVFRPAGPSRWKY